jgi:hypothetical protein
MDNRKAKGIEVTRGNRKRIHRMREDGYGEEPSRGIMPDQNTKKEVLKTLPSRNRWRNYP